MWPKNEKVKEITIQELVPVAGMLEEWGRLGGPCSSGNTCEIGYRHISGLEIQKKKKKVSLDLFFLGSGDFSKYLTCSNTTFYWEINSKEFLNKRSWLTYSSSGII